MDLILIICFISFLSIFFYFYQNKKNRIGGKIAPSKSAWLNFTLIAWFFSPIIIHLNYKTNINSAYFALCISMWIRGILEIYLLFITKNWKPIYGITHNLLTAILFIFIAAYNKLHNYELIMYFTLILSLMLETYYAYFFKIKIGKLTQGEEAIWFASKENPVFKNILRITTLGNLLTYCGFFYFIFKLMRFQN